MDRDAIDHARKFDLKIADDLEKVRLPSFREVLASIRAYLLKNNPTPNPNNVLAILKVSESKGGRLINVGPTFDKGDHDSCYRLGAKAHLSFGVTVRESNGRCALVAYSFRVRLGDDANPKFLRFDLNPDPHDDPLKEPRSHLHPGNDDIRLPFPVMTPLDLLDRIFHIASESATTP